MALGVAKRSLVVKDADASVISRGKAKSTKSKATKTATATKSKPIATKTKTAPKTAAKKKATAKKATAKKVSKPAAKKTAAKKPAAKSVKVKTRKTTTKAKSATKTKASSTKTKPKSTKVSSKDKVKKTATKTKVATDKNVKIHRPDRPEKKLSITRRDRLGHLLLEQLLRNAGFRGMVSTEKSVLAEYATDESIFSISPQLVLQPFNARDVEIAANVVAKETSRFTSLSLTPRGAGTGLSGGSLTDSVVIDTRTHLNNIGDISYRDKTEDVTITVEPGVLWSDLEHTLRSRGYYIPTYNTAAEICSVGGAIANNAAGAEASEFGHCSDWVESLEIVLSDGKKHVSKPLSYKELKALIKKDNAYARIVGDVFSLIEKNETEIKKNRPKTRINTAGYDLWDVVPQGVAAFKKGKGTFDINKLLVGSQGTVGIITSVTMRATALPTATTTICVPVYEVADIGKIITKAEEYKPRKLEVFDNTTYDLALQNPEYFKKYVRGISYYRMMLTMYTNYHVRYSRKLPTYFLLVQLDSETTLKTPASTIAHTISIGKNQARVLYNPIEEDMFWNMRRASYALSKRLDDTKRPAAFLEDMIVPPAQLPKYLTEVANLFKEFNITATMHGHAGIGHFHFYPLLDFTQKTTPALVEKMSEKFYSLATKHGGSLCGEHNDGIIRTPHLDKMFSKKMMDLFVQTEHIFDPDDIFNPGKKVNPRFEVRDVIRTAN